MNDLKKKIDELSVKFDQEKTEDNLNVIFNTLDKLSDASNLSLVEKIVLLINQCIVLDTLGDNNYKINEKTLTRNSIVEEIKIYYEEYVLSSIIDEWENDLNIAFKEKISYFISLILYKVHNYIDAYKYFIESRKFSDSLKNTETNGLNILQQIKRDIYFVYCCEYIGTPLMNCDKLATSLQLLLGVNKKVKDANDYWHQFKEYCYIHIDDLETILSLNKTIEDKTFEIIQFLLLFSKDKYCVFQRLLQMQKNGSDISKEYTESVHVLAHCLNEINLFFSGSDIKLKKNQSSNKAMENLKKKNIIKMIARICIDSLGNKYGTCQATIRAEQGNGTDAILRMHNMERDGLKSEDSAELDFYQYYFESIFPCQNHDQKHNHGEEFRDYCMIRYEENPEIYQDGLLHYYIVLLKNQLKKYLEDFFNSTSKNEDFLAENKRIYHSECFLSYEELRKHEFSQFVNIQIILERKKLIIVYTILRNLQNCKLPLFYEAENFSKKIILDENIEELYNLCKKFNEYSIIKNELLEEKLKNFYYCEQSENCHMSERFNFESNNDSEINEIQNGIPFIIGGLTFEFYGNIRKFIEYLDKYLFASYEIIKQDDLKKNKLNLDNKILFFDNYDERFLCCQKLCYDMNEGGVRIFYVGDSDEDFEYKTIAAFNSINICFLMAYIYESIDRILDYIFNPKPIYILAPLRNVSNYEFQEAEFDSLLKFPQNFINPIEVNSGGIGIQYQEEKMKEIYFNVDFQNVDIKNACVSLIKMYENKLYVLRGEKLVHKNVHIGLVNNMYDDYANARKSTENKRHLKCIGEFNNTPKCSYFYKPISDDKVFSRREQHATKKLIHLLHIACEEQVPSINECYLLQSSFVAKNRLEGEGFELYLFDKDITNFMADQCCFKNVITLTQIDITSKQEKTPTPNVTNSNQEDRKNMIKKISKFIEVCEETIHLYKVKEYKKSLSKVVEIKNASQCLLNQISEEQIIDLQNLEYEYFKLTKELDKIQG